MRDHDDRTIHAEVIGAEQIVRYSRSGKWYVEINGSRKHVSVDEAVKRALALREQGGLIHLGMLGGGTFDHCIRTASRDVPEALSQRQREWLLTMPVWHDDGSGWLGGREILAVVARMEEDAERLRVVAEAAKKVRRTFPGDRQAWTVQESRLADALDALEIEA